MPAPCQPVLTLFHKENNWNKSLWAMRHQLIRRAFSSFSSRYIICRWGGFCLLCSWTLFSEPCVWNGLDTKWTSWFWQGWGMELLSSPAGGCQGCQLCSWWHRHDWLPGQCWLCSPPATQSFNYVKIWPFPTWLLCHYPQTQTFLSMLSVKLISFSHSDLSRAAIPGVTSRSLFTSSPLSLISGKGLRAVTQETETCFSWHSPLWVTVGIWTSAGEAKVKLFTKRPQERRW